METEQLVAETLKAIKDVPPDVAPVAFAKVFDLLAKNGTTTTTSASNGNGSSAATSGTEPLEQIASKLGVDLAVVEQVYDYHAGELNLAIAANKLDNSKARATAEIAQLLAAGRQAIGLDSDGTPTDVVRAAAEHFKRLDGPNFATTIGGLSRVMTVRGSGRSRTLKMTSPAWAAAAELVRRLTGA